MATLLGKRKRRPVKSAEDGRQDDEDTTLLELNAQEIFRRHFEARFKPLPQAEKKAPEAIEEQLEVRSEEGSEWDGISDKDESAVQVVEHTDAQSRMATMSKEEIKSYMSSKPPTATLKIPEVDGSSKVAVDDDVSEAANLKKDLALQRLLAESHLLESATNPTLSGNNRHKATDLRIQALGAKTSILKQDKMPMSHRKGMIAKQTEREGKRRREARENGIILEKAKPAKKISEKKRDRGVDAPGVGTFSGGTLKLSKKDIFDIEGPKRSTSGRGGRGGKAKRGTRG